MYVAKTSCAHCNYSLRKMDNDIMKIFKKKAVKDTNLMKLA